MITEYSLSGVFFPVYLVSAVVAYALSLVLRVALTRANIYRFVWHPALFDLAVFVLLWAFVASAPSPLRFWHRPDGLLAASGGQVSTAQAPLHTAIQ